MHAGTIHVLEESRIVRSDDDQAFVDRKGLCYALWREPIGERK